MADQQVKTTTAFDPAVAKSEMQLTLSKAGLIYQSVLQSGEGITFTKDDIETGKEPLLTLRKVKKTLEDLENPHTAAWKGWNEARSSLLTPVKELLTRKEGDLRKVAQEIEEDRKRVEAENKRKNDIQQLMTDFILTQSQAIAAAKTSNELASIEKLIGANKNATVKFQEFLPEFVTRCEELTPLIKAQKDVITKLEEAKKKEEEGRQSGNDQAVLDSMEEQQALAGKLEETKVVVQETAINQAVNNRGVVTEVAPTTVKARRTTWKAEIVNMDEAVKKSRHLLDITLNAGKVNESIRTLKDSGVFTGKTEHIVNGIRYFEEKSY